MYGTAIRAIEVTCDHGKYGSEPHVTTFTLKPSAKPVAPFETKSAVLAAPPAAAEEIIEEAIKPADASNTVTWPIEEASAIKLAQRDRDFSERLKSAKEDLITAVATLAMSPVESGSRPSATQKAINAAKEPLIALYEEAGVEDPEATANDATTSISSSIALALDIARQNPENTSCQTTGSVNQPDDAETPTGTIIQPTAHAKGIVPRAIPKDLPGGDAVGSLGWADENFVHPEEPDVPTR